MSLQTKYNQYRLIWWPSAPPLSRKGRKRQRQRERARQVWTSPLGPAGPPRLVTRRGGRVSGGRDSPLSAPFPPPKNNSRDPSELG